MSAVFLLRYVGIEEIKMQLNAILQFAARYSQRILLIMLVIGALISIKLGSSMFPGKIESSATAPSSTLLAARHAQSNERIPQSVQSFWKKVTGNIKRGRTAPACSDVQRSLNQCK
jgi:hypothetical protein